MRITIRTTFTCMPVLSPITMPMLITAHVHAYAHAPITLSAHAHADDAITISTTTAMLRTIAHDDFEGVVWHSHGWGTNMRIAWTW